MLNLSKVSVYVKASYQIHGLGLYRYIKYQIYTLLAAFGYSEINKQFPRKVIHELNFIHTFLARFQTPIGAHYIFKTAACSVVMTFLHFITQAKNLIILFFAIILFPECGICE